MDIVKIMLYYFIYVMMVDMLKLSNTEIIFSESRVSFFPEVFFRLVLSPIEQKL